MAIHDSGINVKPTKGDLVVSNSKHPRGKGIKLGKITRIDGGIAHVLSDENHESCFIWRGNIYFDITKERNHHA